jgi:hypothetical protein
MFSLPKRKIQGVQDFILETEKHADLYRRFFPPNPQDAGEGWSLPKNGMSAIESICNEAQRYLKREGHDLWRYIYDTFFSTNFSEGVFDVDKLKDKLPNDGQSAFFDLCLLGMWRLSRNIFRFDPTLFEILKDTEENDLPGNCLDKYPYWSTYIEIPPHLSVNCDDQKELIVGLLITSASALIFDSRDLTRDKFFITKIAEDIETKQLFSSSAIEMVAFKGKLGFGNILSGVSMDHPLVSLSTWSTFWLATNLLLYINTYLQSIYNENKPGLIENPTCFHKGRITKWIASSKNTTWNIGTSVGEQIRAYNKTNPGSHNTKSPHIRRAHWHTYWTGPKVNQSPVLRWIPPIPVAMPREEIVTRSQITQSAVA